MKRWNLTDLFATLQNAIHQQAVPVFVDHPNDSSVQCRGNSEQQVLLSRDDPLQRRAAEGVSRTLTKVIDEYRSGIG